MTDKTTSPLRRRMIEDMTVRGDAEIGLTTVRLPQRLPVIPEWLPIEVAGPLIALQRRHF